jgi:hypothetical protein
VSETCEMVTITARGVSPACGLPATWIYTNGDYRRLECDRHAAETQRVMRRYIEGPQPRLTPLTPPPDPR